MTSKMKDLGGGVVKNMTKGDGHIAEAANVG